MICWKTERTDDVVNHKLVAQTATRKRVSLDLFFRWIFTLHHGKSKSNHHLGEYVWNLFQASYANPSKTSRCFFKAFNPISPCFGVFRIQHLRKQPRIHEVQDRIVKTLAKLGGSFKHILHRTRYGVLPPSYIRSQWIPPEVFLDPNGVIFRFDTCLGKIPNLTRS